jgi:hypothetical protein
MIKTMFKVFVVMALILSTNLPASADRHGGYGGHGGHGGGEGLGWLFLPAIFAAEILTLPFRYPYYAEPPPVVVREQPPAYIPPQQPAAPVQHYWYYCQNPQGYYPNVRQCTHQWMRVVPTPPPAGEPDYYTPQ